eukprot:CAMPEP_0119064664 /NCGR_PEP_ID=MMETSP1178-20130426/7687_1 /TAXON_ID=33656 /ORGANISM="unid sp, Strain CCMP2000" /LENGTH=98 /DNA_ID=CAMNT_0007046121 /DNA_START=210 /DNA_END=503 /DNA_ORIENTATION=-
MSAGREQFSGGSCMQYLLPTVRAYVEENLLTRSLLAIELLPTPGPPARIMEKTSCDGVSDTLCPVALVGPLAGRKAILVPADWQEYTDEGRMARAMPL